MNNLKYFLLYPNAPVVYGDQTCKVLSVHKVNSLSLIDPLGYEFEFVDADYCKLILKKLSSITEEHKRELAEVLTVVEGCKIMEIVIDTDYENISTIHCYDLQGYQELFYRMEIMPVKAADYLRENSYDIDCLIEKGFAVEELTPYYNS